MMLAVYALKLSATAILQRYKISMCILKLLWLGMGLLFLTAQLVSIQVTSCKHEFHLQCILEW